MEKTWKYFYKEDQEKRSITWSRVRNHSFDPVTFILKKMHDSKSNIFSRCKFCHSGLMIKGICVTCGICELCSICKKVIQPDRSSKHMKYDHKNVSHGYCFIHYKYEERLLYHEKDN